ncbi:MAG TPA: energy transducer TonB [Rhodocyclaceae bacterium]|nr:energy transducer TonB [Rhodocyclaceae bacterium]
MNLSDLPPLSVEAHPPCTGERLVRWGSVIALHLVLLYGILHYSIQQDLITLPPSLAVRLLPVQEVQKPEAAPPPPKPAPPARKAPPLAPQPVLAAKATEAPAAFAVAPQPPAPVQAPAPAPVAAPKAAAPAAVTAARFDADYLHNPKPVYPTLSRRNGEEGKVLLRVKVGPEGTALELEIKQSSNYPRLDNAAREAVAKWRFIPAKRGDDAFESWVTVPIAFALTE